MNTWAIVYLVLIVISALQGLYLMTRNGEMTDRKEKTDVGYIQFIGAGIATVLLLGASGVYQ